MRCTRDVGGRACRSPLTWKAIVKPNEYFFCTRHKKSAEKMQFWRGAQWVQLASQSAKACGEK